MAVGIVAMTTASTLSAAVFRTETVEIPFAFQVAKTTLPAGEYRVEQKFGSSIAFLVNVKTGRQVQVLRSVGNIREDRAKLVFENTAEGRVLKTIS
jgi:hypothetical protein